MYTRHIFSTMCTVSCHDNTDCPDKMACFDFACANPCNLSVIHCGRNAACQAANHEPTCKCEPGYTGNPLASCEASACRSDEACPADMACVARKCQKVCNPSSCGRNTECKGIDHKAQCSCLKGHSGNPHQRCEKTTGACSVDSDCPSAEACIESVCRNACNAVQPCGLNTACTAVDKTPQVTLVCSCLSGFAGDAKVECRPSLSNIECTNDKDCPITSSCIHNRCHDPCDTAGCGRNSYCRVVSRKPICTCHRGYVGNADEECSPTGCKDNSQCPSDRVCRNDRCVNPCAFPSLCGRNAECLVRNRHAECHCLPGFEGNPTEICVTTSCRTDNDCPQDKACLIGHCQDPCTSAICGRGTNCSATNHQATCSCKKGFSGNPWVQCSPNVGPCSVDADCTESKACINERCVNPCEVVRPCAPGAVCKVINSEPALAMACLCPAGYMGDATVECQRVSTHSFCRSDNDCRMDEACINEACQNPCSSCGTDAVCQVSNHHPVCACPPDYTGNPDVFCYKEKCQVDFDCPESTACISGKCVDACVHHNDTCASNAKCTTEAHALACRCKPGYEGDGRSECARARCRADSSECPGDHRCSGGFCVDPCVDELQPCSSSSVCHTSRHHQYCVCLPGYTGDSQADCKPISPDGSCVTDFQCPTNTACLNGRCSEACTALKPCGRNAECVASGARPLVTLNCKCLRGYSGNPLVECTETSTNASCRVDGDCADSKACIDNICQSLCPVSSMCGQNAVCVMVDHRPQCYCPPPLTGNAYASCNPMPGCTEDSECPGNLICRNNECSCWPNLIQVQDFCIVAISRNCTTTDECPVNEECQPLVRRCYCPKPNILHPNGTCEPYPPGLIGKTVPPPEYPPTGSVVVNCRADGIHVDVPINEPFDGVVYVKGYSKDESCRRVVYAHQPPGTMPFIVRFNTCGLIPIDGIASFILVIQRHPKLVTHKARAYDVKCVYHTGEKTISLAFNVSMITTSGTIANTGPPPTCIMRICNSNGEDISTAEIGEILMLKLEVTPKNVYGGFARSCYALPMEDGKESYPVTDENGCALDPAVFGEWSYDEVKQVLLASFNAFKFPNGNTIRFQCDVKVCFGQCQPVNCNGVDAYGRRRKRQARTGIEKDVGDDASLANRNTVDEYTKITMNSNAIQVVDRRDQQAQQNGTESGELQKPDEVCVSMTGLIIALVITALLALVAIAVAVSCWLMAYRRKPKGDGPLPHPADFPNPLYTTPEPIMEPSPDYLS